MKNKKPATGHALFSAAGADTDEQPKERIAPRTEAAMRRMRSPFTVDDHDAGRGKKS
jgi:hypothetical protein